MSETEFEQMLKLRESEEENADMDPAYKALLDALTVTKFEGNDHAEAVYRIQNYIKAQIMLGVKDFLGGARPELIARLEVIGSVVVF